MRHAHAWRFVAPAVAFESLPTPAFPDGWCCPLRSPLRLPVMCCGLVAAQAMEHRVAHMRRRASIARNETSAISFGLTHCAQLDARRHGRVETRLAWRRSHPAGPSAWASVASSKPLPTLPHSAAPLSSCTPSSSEPKPVREPFGRGVAADHELLARLDLQLDPVHRPARDRRLAALADEPSSPASCADASSARDRLRRRR
jgi:hypothetical protein